MLLPLPSRGLGMPGRRAGSPVEVHVRYARDLQYLVNPFQVPHPANNNVLTPCY